MSLAMCVVAGQASAGQGRQRSAPPSSSPRGSSSQGSQGGQSDRGRSEAQSQRREAPAPQASQPQSSRNGDARSNAPRGNNDMRGNNDARTYSSRGNDSRSNDAGRYDNRSTPQRQAIPAPRDRYIDQNRNGRDDRYDGRNDNRYDSRYDNRNDRGGSFLGGVLGGLLGLGRDGRYSSRYTPQYRYSSSYRYDDYRHGSRIYIAPRNYTRFSSSWFSFRPYSRLSIGLTMGYPVAFPTWYDPYVLGSAGYSRPSMPYGGVTFDVDPRDADLWVDGDYMGPVSDYSSYAPPLTLVAGRHHIELAVSNDRALSFDITVVAGQVIPYQGTVPYYR